MTKNPNKKSILLIFSLLFMLHQVMAQTKAITGNVSDGKGNAVAGASISVKGSKVATSTDATGSFKLSVPSSAKTLFVTSVGFASKEIAIESETNFTITLAAAEGSTLNEVVVTGYGTARKKDVTGAISSISAKDFNVGAITTPMDQVSGKVPGLVVTTPDGDPNSNPVIRLRGQTSLLGTQTPLLVVDGVILDNYELLSSIPPGDIASFDFLKDASAAAIYGARGANGVVLITTRQGRSGSFQIDYSGAFGMAKDAKYYDNFHDAHSFLVAAATQGADTAALDQGGNTDWQKAITRTGYSQTHNIGLSGGAGNFSYRASAYYQNTEGIVINNGRQQLGYRINLDQKALKGKLDIQLNMLNTQTNHQNVNSNIFYWSYNIPPTVPEYTNGQLTPINNYNYLNPVWVQQNELWKSVDYLRQGIGTVNYEIIKGLKAGVSGNISRLNSQYDFYYPVNPAVGSPSQGFKYSNNYNSDKGDFHINYAGSFGKHNITATAVYEYNYYEDDAYSASGQGFQLDINQNNSLQSGNNALNVISSGKEEYKLISLVARATYNYDSRFYLTASYRRDGSSKFGADHAWGNFPAFSAAWRISQEKFLKDVSWIDELKINAGFGVTGNSEPIGPYNSKLLLSPNAYGYTPTGSSAYSVGYAPSQNLNPDLRWETRIGKNLGLDFSFLKSRITGNLSVFSDKTSNLLYNYGVPIIPPAITYPTILANVGTMTNKGVELGLNVQIVRKKDVQWSIGGQISTVRTRITSLSGTWDGNAVSSNHIQQVAAGGQGLSFNPLTYYQVGYYPGVFYLPHYTGHDASGTQLLDSAGVKSMTLAQNQNPTYYYTDPSPKFTYGFNTTVSYKGFSYNVAFTGNYGQKVYDNTRLNMSNYGRFPGLNSLKELFTNGLKDNPTTSDYWLEKASYLRCQSMTFSYTFPKINDAISSLRVYVTGNNLFIITPYKGLDPEVSPYNSAGGTRSGVGQLATVLSSNYGGLGGAGSGGGYLDNNYAGQGFYPRSRTYTIGVSITVK